MSSANKWIAALAVFGGIVAVAPDAQAQFLPPIDPAYATPQALLQRDFNYMQSTRPGAQRNTMPPQPGTPGYRSGYPYGRTQHHYFPPYQWQPSYGYYNGYYGYFNPTGVFIVVNPATSIQQREVIIYREGTTGNPAYPQQNQGSGANSVGGEGRAPQGRPTTEPEKPRTGDDFYLGRGTQTETITDALDDIRKAWLNGDFGRLKARFKSEGQVRVYPKGQFKYAVPAQEFLGMVKDAMTRLDTVALEFDRPKSESAGKVFVSGKHTFIDAEKNRSESYISYGLERQDGKWVITEAGSSSTAAISKHE